MSAAEAQLKLLMLAANAGDKAAYRGLLGALGEQLRRYYRRRLPAGDANVEDLVQETFARVLRKPRLIRSEDDIGYLLRVLRNTFVSSRRTAATQ